MLKPVNRYKHRPLPHLIGSAEFRTDQTLGLREAPSDEETDDFLSASDKVNTSDLTLICIRFFKLNPQTIQWLA